MPNPPLLSFNQFSPDEWWRKISLTAWGGGAVELPDNGCWLPADDGSGVVGLVFTRDDGAFVVHMAVQHMIKIIINVSIDLFRAITISFR